MTSTPVSNVGLNVPYATESGANLPKGGSDFKDSFKTAMENQTGAMNLGTQNTANVTAPAKNTDQVKSVDKTDRSVTGDKADLNKKQDSVSGTQKGTGTKDKMDKVSPETVEAVDDATKQVINEVAEQMDVTPEEVVEAMETLGLTMVDLLDPSNMTGLVMEITGIEDAMSILTDEGLYDTLGNLQEFVTTIDENLMEELDLTQEALNEVLVQTEELMGQEKVDVMDSTFAQTMENADDVNIEGAKDFKTTVNVNGEQLTMSVRVDDTSGAQAVSYQTTGQNGSEQSSERKDSDEMSQGDELQSNSLFTANEQMNITETPVVNDMTDQVASFRTEASDIANQIMDSMKANLKAEMTELEMNLHPASLGSVRVNLTAQNGQVSAQFLAQNETVKSAIEAQIVQLTNQLEDQGIKVEHVEVAVANHSFERNPEDNSSREQSRDEQSGKPKVGRIRRLDLNGLDGELEELEDSDRIAAEMMAHDGNTVDYTV